MLQTQGALIFGLFNSLPIYLPPLSESLSHHAVFVHIGNEDKVITAKFKSIEQLGVQ